MAGDVDWLAYFRRISKQCPWSYQAYKQNLIDIVDYTGETYQLGKFKARVYVVDMSNDELESLADELDQGNDAWLFSYPGYGPWASDVPILIQQDRSLLEDLRSKLDE